MTVTRRGLIAGITGTNEELMCAGLEVSKGDYDAALVHLGQVKVRADSLMKLIAAEQAVDALVDAVDVEVE